MTQEQIPAAVNRSLDQIEADIAVTRARIAGRIDEFHAYVRPQALAQRQVAKVKEIYVDEFGGVRPERVLVTVAVVAGLLALRALRRRSRR